MLEEDLALLEQIVRADDRRVAPGIAAAEPALLDDGDVGDAMIFGEVVGSRQAVPAATDDDDVVGGIRRRAAPCLRPALVVAQRVARQAEDRIALLRRESHLTTGKPSGNVTGNVTDKYTGCHP